MRIRFTKKLNDLVKQTAIHCRKSDSDIIRAAFVSYTRRTSLVVHIAVDETYYKGGDVIKTVRGLDNVDDAERFKQHLASRCMLELQKPRCKVRNVANIAQHPPRSLYEALQMECYAE